MPELHTFSREEVRPRPQPNLWDFVVLCLIIGTIFLLAWGAKAMAIPYELGEVIPVTLDPQVLPYYALRSVLRMFIALGFSLLFTFIFGTLAAKYKMAERLIIPAIDILQSVPILGFLAIALWGFIALFPGSLLGPECAAIFAILTSQVWNMILSFYQSLRTVPHEFKDVAHIFHLSVWQCFWRIEVPFTIPGLLWNTMVSMSAGWFFVVASEAISIAHQTITLPGIGSYIALAIAEANKPAILYAILTMLGVILIYDQLLFRPLVQWSTKFQLQSSLEEDERPWVTRLFHKARLIRYWGGFLGRFSTFWMHLPFFSKVHAPPAPPSMSSPLRSHWFFYALGLVMSLSLFLAANFFVMTTHITWHEVLHVGFLGLITFLRIFVLTVLCILIWAPTGVWIGRRPRIAAWTQPIVQFLAAFPANLLFPMVVIFIVRHNLNVEIWTSPLMILGTQWYILFNVIAGSSNIPESLYQVANSLQVKLWLRWRRLILPGIMPYLITGTISAVGGAWNASILAEAVCWGNMQLNATGLGAYIAHHTSIGDFYKVALGITLMCLYVLVINRLVWQPLYNLAEERFCMQL